MSGYHLTKFTFNLPPQRVTVRCACGWYTRNVLVTESTKLYESHLTGKRHNGINRKSGPQAKTLDKRGGRSWA